MKFAFVSQRCISLSGRQKDNQNSIANDLCRSRDMGLVRELEIIKKWKICTLKDVNFYSLFSRNPPAIWTFMPLVARFGFSYQQRTKTSHAMFKWKHRQKAKARNQKHLPVLVFEIELILSQKQERATKSSKQQRTANGNTPPKPKRATKEKKVHIDGSS